MGDGIEAGERGRRSADLRLTRIGARAGRVAADAVGEVGEEGDGM